jgi:hypothetical protein
MRGRKGGGAARLSRPIRRKYCIEGGKGEWTNDEVTSEFSESYFILVKHKRHRKAVSVQKAENNKTLIFMLLGEITFVIRPDAFL